MIQHTLFFRSVTFLTLITFLSFQVAPASALFGSSIPSASSMAKSLEKRYHIDKDAVQNFGEGFNVSSQKINAPEVMLLFQPTNPKPGEEITATAFPMYFSNPKDRLYFTWYLKHKECDLDGNVNDNKKWCDADGDGAVTVNDWKVEAMRMIASSTYEKEDDEDIENKSQRRDNNSDSFFAPFGGESSTFSPRTGMSYFNLFRQGGGNAPAYCYIHDFDTGTSYELAEAEETNLICPSGYKPACLENTSLICPSNFDASSTASGDGGSGGDASTGGSATSSSTVGGQLFDTFYSCQNVNEQPSCTSGLAALLSVGNDDAGDDLAYGQPTCSSGDPYCVPDSFALGSGDDCADASCENITGIQPLTSCTTVKKTSIKNLCEHMFPFSPNPRDNDNRHDYWGGSRDFFTGDGEFGEKEENFWGTSIYNDDTAGTGKKDEGNVAGVGRDMFTWNYQTGDKVGVIVEGLGTQPTKHENASYMVMWALPKNDCTVTNTSSYTKEIRGYSVEIPTTTMDLNACLEDNLVDPREGGSGGSLDVSLQYTPDNPVNDMASNLGDELLITALTSGSTQQAQFLEYSWDVYVSRDGTFNPREYNVHADDTNDQTAGWVNITGDLQDKELMGPSIGNGLDSILLALNMDDGILPSGSFENGFGYFKIRATVREYLDDNTVRKGQSHVIVKVNFSQETITAHRVTLSGDGRFQLGTGAANVICDIQDSAICYVVKNEVIGLSFDRDDEFERYTWQVNGSPLICSERISGSCDNEKQTKRNFLPIVGAPGSRYVVTVTAIGKDNSNTVISRVFEVVEPSVLVAPAGENAITGSAAQYNNAVWKKHLGHYTDIENNDEIVEYRSENVLQALVGMDIVLTPEFRPRFVDGRSVYQWKVDGVVVDNSRSDVRTDQGNLVIEDGYGTAGSAHTVTIEALHGHDPGEVAQQQAFQKAMKSLWGISVFDTAEKRTTSSVQLEFVEDVFEDEGAQTAFLSDPKVFFASIVLNAPKQFVFILQLALTVTLVILVFGFVSSLGGSRRVSL